MKKKLEFISFLLIMVVCILSLFYSIKATYSPSYIVYNDDLISYSKCLVFVGLISLIVYIIGKIKNIKFTIYEKIVFLLILLAMLSLFTTIDINTALFGRKYRYEGLFVILTYYILLLIGMNIKNKNYVKIIIGSILFSGVINILYGLLQLELLPTFGVDIRASWVYAIGFQENSMFFGTYMCLCYPIVVSIFLETKRKFLKILFLPLLVLFSIGIFISGSMGAILSITCINILILCNITNLFLKKEKKKALYFLLCNIINIMILIFSFSFVFHTNETFRSDILELFDETTSITNGEIKEEFGTGRIYIWKNTINKIKENHYLGVGIDNFYNAFNPPLIDSISGFKVDKAHNDYLQKILCEGLLPGLLFIFFLVLIFFKKYSMNPLFLSFTCYSIQAFFGISVIKIAPIYFIIIGIILAQNNSTEEKDKKCLE